MGFLDKIAQQVSKPHTDQYRKCSNFKERFKEIDTAALADSGKAILSFYRERCIRGNARNFRIFLDGREVRKIRMEEQCDIVCEAGIRSLYVKLDSLASPIVNVRVDAGKRYFFDIACTMEDGMILKHIQEEE